MLEETIELIEQTSSIIALDIKVVMRCMDRLAFSHDRQGMIGLFRAYQGLLMREGYGEDAIKRSLSDLDFYAHWADRCLALGDESLAHVDAQNTATSMPCGPTRLFYRESLSYKP